MRDEADPPEPLPRIGSGEGDDRLADGVDELYRMLADARRRRVLWFLLEHPRTTMEELADVVVGWRASTGAVVGPDDRREIAVSLHHVHLPLLDQAGLLCYDHGSGAVELASLPEGVRTLIRRNYRSEGADGDDGRR